jgi:phosphatidylinositol alpha-1,6-mannosyltransferase
LILAVQSTTFGSYGGIPAYNRLICRALNESLESGEVLIATDSAANIESASIELPKLRLRAFNQNRVALTRGFLRLALRQEIDLILVGHVNYSPLALLLKSFKPQLKYGVILYGIEAWRPLSSVRRRAVEKADFLISISEYTKEKAVESNRLDFDRFHVLPNALQNTNCSPKNIGFLSSTGVGRRLLSVCRLDQSERYKGVDTVIECLPELVKRVSDVQYTVVGGGNDLERHRKLAEGLGVAGHVQFLGFVSDEVLEECYRECDLFVLPSAGEGFGFVFLEAMKHGKPIVAARSGGAPEVVRDELNGKLVEYGNRHELLKALTDLCLDEDKRERLGSSGYHRLQENYTFELFKRRFAEIIDLESPQSARRFSQSHESHSCAS